MTDEEKMKLARECAANVRPFSHNSALIKDGDRDGTDIVQSALAAINALAPRLEEAEKLLREVCADLACPTPVSTPDARICDDVERLARASGYGAIMTTASALWRKFLAEKSFPEGGEFIAGPCRTTVERMIGRITAFLKQGEAS